MSRGATPYASDHAAGYRMVVDFADLESSLYIISTGQSGHFLSPHYDDLSQIWRRGGVYSNGARPQFGAYERTGSDGFGARIRGC